MIVVQRAARNGSVAALVEIGVTTLALLVVFRIVVTQASLAIFGVWALAQSLTSIIRLADVGFAASLSKFIGQIEPEEKRDRVWLYVDTALAFNIVFYTLLTIAAYWPACWALRHNLSAEQAELGIAIMPLILINLILSTLQGVLTSALVGMLRGTGKSVIAIVGAIILLVSTASLLPLMGLAGLVLAQTVQFAFGIIVSWVYLSHAVETGNGVRFRFKADYTILRETFGISINLQINNIISALYEIVVKLALSRFGGAASVGLYELADRVMKVGRQIILMPTSLAVPVLARSLASGRHKAASRIFERQIALTLLTCVLIFGAIAVATPLVSLIVLQRLDPVFFAFTAIVWISSCCNALAIPAYLLGVAAGRLRGNYIGNIWILVGALVFANLGGWLFGPIGALAGGGASLASGGLITMLVNGHDFGLRVLPRLRDFRAIRSSAGIRRLLAPVLR